jgi:hypothetical protein
VSRSFPTILLLTAWCSLSAQKKNEGFVLQIKKTTSSVTIDGDERDEAWRSAQKADNFFMITPMDTSKATVSTEVRMCYDDQNIYLLAVCHKKLSGPYMVESLRRDFAFGKNDNFLVFIDPFDDQVNGFAFGANAAGAQWDGMMYDGSKVDLNWDNKWKSVVTNREDAWVLEAAIPFKTIRYKKGIRKWGINFSRLDIRVPEKSSWAPVPRQFPSAALAYSGILLWDEEPPQPGTNLSIIPYMLGGLRKSHIPVKPGAFKREMGLDAKVSLNSSLNMDLTINPDFSQVEVDRQVTNLDRFELFFPERRQFFLENGDQFSNFGYSSIRPFFSRRIGLNAPIIAGARVSGKINKDWRMGAMDMLTGKVDSVGLPAQNYAVLALQRRVFSRSNLGFLYIDKQSFAGAGMPDTSKATSTAYNRNLGLEYNLASQNNQWTGKAILVKSFSPGLRGEDWVHAGSLQFSNRHITAGWQHEYVGRNYTAEAGYVPRRDHIRLSPVLSRNFFPKGGPVLNHTVRIASSLYYTPQWKQTDNETFIAYTIVMRNQTTFSTYLSYDFVQLRAPFDPTNTGKDTLTAGSRHRWNAIGMEFVSKPQSLLTFGFSSRYGGYYADGTRLNITTDIGYRFQPYVSLAISASYNEIRLPEPWNRTRFWLIGPRMDVTLTNTLFFTAFLQYNEQQRNVNLNTRFQWRYRPASDLYLVYTDNYYSNPLMVRNRALVLKFNYWWNL